MEICAQAPSSRAGPLHGLGSGREGCAQGRREGVRQPGGGRVHVERWSEHEILAWV